MPTQDNPALPGLSVLERGWLSSNNIVLHGAPGEGATLVDSGHCVHAQQTVALVRQALGDEALARVVNTHLHSDHCGGNARLAREFGMPVSVPTGLAAAVRDWDEDALTYRWSGQRCERFQADGTLAPGETLKVGTRQWQVLAAPGHDPDSLVLFDADDGVLISADALWQNGFGLVFPELVGTPAFDEVAGVLEMIAGLPVRVVIPGHGAPFSDVGAALQRARARLQGMRDDPAKHGRHGARVMIKYHMMEERSQRLPELMHWALATPLFEQVWRRFGLRDAASPRLWCEAMIDDLIAGGALRLHEGMVHDG